jgi:hypothetical protein
MTSLQSAALAVAIFIASIFLLYAILKFFFASSSHD